MKIALAGNPNSGKTTLFNAITGKTEYVGNWPGVTVDKKEAVLRARYRKLAGEVRVVDLPGAYSIAPFTGEEAITRDFVTGESPDVIINIVDAVNLERSLFFTTQLLEIGVPVVMALNKQDAVRRYGSTIDMDGISKALGCRVVPTVAQEGEGLSELVRAAVEAAAAGKAVEVTSEGNAEKAVAEGNAEKAAAERRAQQAPQFDGKGTADEDDARQRFCKQIAASFVRKMHEAGAVRFDDKLDRVLAHGIFGLPIFALIMWAVYWFSIEGLGGFLSGYLNDTLFGEVIPDAANAFFEGIGVHPLLQALIVDGAIGGVGAVVGFLPLIMVLFFFLALLEDSGYMARVAVVMDRFFKKFGLSGKSIIPMIVGSGCSIPGVMATRTIEDPNEKRMTTMLTPFVPCGAKLPVIALFSAVFFPGVAWVAPSVYLLAFAMIALGGLLLKRIFVWDNQSAFIMELPDYRLPSLKHAVRQMLKQGKAFLIKASTIILVMNTLVWLLQTYNWRLQAVADPSLSMLATLGGVIAPLLLPLGFMGWQMAAASVSGFIAKENVVATFAIVLATATDEALHMPGGVLTQFFTPVTAYAFLAFNLFTPPCFAAMGAMNVELGSRKWLGRTLLFQFSVGYLVSMLITQIGTPLVYGRLAPGALAAVVIALVAGAAVALLIRRSDGERRRLELAAGTN